MGKNFRTRLPTKEEEDVKEEIVEEPPHSRTGKFNKKDYHKDAKLKPWRLIIRNIPFKTTKADLQTTCSRFGTFTEIIIPPSKKYDKGIAGFAFVQFTKQEAAEAAKKHFNENKFLDRTVAADWAIDKDTYESTVHEEKKQLAEKVKDEKMDVDGNLSENDDDDESSSSDEAEDDEGEEKKPVRPADHAVEEHRAVFVRNLSYTTDSETLEKHMKKYGEVTVAVICKYRDSGHSRGTAFVHFKTAAEAEACINAANTDQIEIDGRYVKAQPAVSRDDAEKLEKEKLTKVPKDNRNVRLMRFGWIREGTSEAKGMSAEDTARRVKLAQAMKKKLENLQMFVSPTRLVVHNLPKNMSDEKLRDICKNAAGTSANIIECRIWKDLQRVDAKGKSMSKGFAFVNFTEHKDAMTCLQKLNNNPTTFSNERRPIVVFSIEDITALQTKSRRMAKAKGETLNDRQLADRVKQQLKKSISEVHTAGMKPLPKNLGKKIRHKDSKKLRSKAKKSKTSAVTPAKLQKTATGKVSKKRKRNAVTKVLALSA